MPLQRRLRIIACDIEGNSLMENTLRVAFASSDMKQVNQHFGSAESFVIYQLDQQQAQFVEVAQFAQHEQDGNEDKLLAKFSVLEGCAAVYCQAIGASAMRQLLAKGIQPVKVSEGSEIKQLIIDLQTELQTGAPRWLTQSLKRTTNDPNRFAKMEAEGWSE